MNRMSDFKIVIDADIEGVESHRFLETPISGPGKANRLVTITGIAIPNADFFGQPLAHGDIFILTEYRIKDLGEFEGIVDGNKALLAATYASLASISYGGDSYADPPPSFTAAVDSVDTRVADGRIVVHLVVGLQGVTSIHRISYQANVLVRKVG